MEFLKIINLKEPRESEHIFHEEKGKGLIYKNLTNKYKEQYINKHNKESLNFVKGKIFVRKYL